MTKIDTLSPKEHTAAAGNPDQPTDIRWYSTGMPLATTRPSARRIGESNHGTLIDRPKPQQTQIVPTVLQLFPLMLMFFCVSVFVDFVVWAVFRL